jgi:C1A family cysteine protease
MSRNYKLTYKFQKKDERDHIFKAVVSEDNELEHYTITKPKTNEVIKKTTKKSPLKLKIENLGNILDQENYGSCVANAFAFNINGQTKKTLTISRMYLYDFCRILDYTSLDQDYGTTLRTACSVIKKYGAVKENSYQYNEKNFYNLPSLSVLKQANYFKKFQYLFINQDLVTIKNYLNTYKNPIIFGFLVYSSFYDVNSSGIVSLPNTSTETLEGGHAMCIVGYNNSLNSGSFICANSWGKYWGDNGYCYIPYNYLLDPNLASDFCSAIFVY